MSEVLEKVKCWFCGKELDLSNGLYIFEVRDNQFAPWYQLPVHKKCAKESNNGKMPRTKRDDEY